MLGTPVCICLSFEADGPGHELYSGASQSLDIEYAQLLTEKKTAYGEYRQAREEMKELSIIKHNTDKLLGRQEQEKSEKKQEQERR